jgi:hypothetical protein
MALFVAQAGSKRDEGRAAALVNRGRCGPLPQPGSNYTRSPGLPQLRFACSANYYLPEKVGKVH